MRLPRPAYRLLIIVHVAASVAWLGLSLSLLVLTATVLAADRAPTQFAAGQAAAMLAGTLAVPLGATALASGLALSLGTRWSLRYRWVLVKFVATAAAFALTLVLLRPGLAALAADLSPDRLVAVDGDAVAGPIVSSAIFIGAIALSYLKPWGALGRPRPTARPRVPARSSR
ncbi:DUF2269 domain-containing protein [Glycomyces xiaoerkulensis]|uniref:DUF2269 domain-containing protein n=1 Tax=Glycomyces xiaoerkulensis TaxID=2038139 RepID=UPI0012FFFBB9|nr:DUF2269 domain-containing protein [Glycomyces xiaoerkulensis]